MLPIATEKLSFSAVEALVLEGDLRESKALDFKRDQLGTNDEAKREFLADVSAFANTDGGDLVFGIDETDAVASSIPGITPPNADAEVLRLQSILLSGLEPRIAKTEVRWFAKASESRGILVVRVPRSFALPHRVIANNKFFGRTSSGKYALDVAELRSRFLSSDTLVQHIRRFRLDRVATIQTNDGPFPLRSRYRAVLHIVPISSFTSRTDITVGDRGAMLQPLRSEGGFNWRYSLDGFVTYPGAEDAQGARLSYTLLFRTGAIEAAFDLDVGTVDQKKPTMSPTTVETRILNNISPYLRALSSQHDIDGPFYIFLSLIGVRHLSLPNNFFYEDGWPLTQNELIIPEVIMDDVRADPATALRPLFDLLWNAFGRPCSPNYDQSGKYGVQRV